MHVGTHDIANCLAFQQESTEITLTISFTAQSRATGAYLNFVFINEDGIVDFEKSASQAIERVDALNSLIFPLHLRYPGQYVAYAYDIESNRRISNGIGYQSCSCEFRIIDDRGKLVYSETMFF